MKAEGQSHCFNQVNYIIEEFGYSRALLLRGIFFADKKEDALALPDILEALKKYEFEDFSFFTGHQSYIFNALEKSKTIFLYVNKSTPQAIKTKSAELSHNYESNADRCFAKKNYLDALLYFSLALWYEDEKLQTTSYRISHLYTMRAHIHLILSNLREANYNLAYAARFHDDVQSFIHGYSQDKIDRLAMHVLYKSDKKSQAKPDRYTPYLLKLKAAEIFFETDYTNLGLGILIKAIKEFPHLPTAYAMRCDFFLKTLHLKHALMDAMAGLNISPLNVKLIIDCMTLNKKLEFFEAAEAHKTTLTMAMHKQNYFSAWYNQVLCERTKSLPAQESVSLVFQAIEALYSERYDLSIFLCTQALDLNHNDCVAQTYRGLAHFLSGEAVAALPDFRNCINGYEYSLAYFGLGLLLHSKSDLMSAYKSFQNAFMNTGAGDFYIYQQQEAIIIDCFKQTSVKYPVTEQDNHFKKGMVYFEDGSFEQAKLFFSTAIWLPESYATYRYYFYRSYCFLNIGLPEAAYQDAKRAIESAKRKKVPEEEIIILKKLFANYCLTPVVNFITQVTNQLSYYNHGIAIHPTKELLLERALYHDEHDNPAAAAADMKASNDLSLKERELLLYDTAEAESEKKPAAVETINTVKAPEGQKARKKKKPKKKQPGKLSVSNSSEKTTLPVTVEPTIIALPVTIATVKPNITISEIESAFPNPAENITTPDEIVTPAPLALAVTRNAKRRDRRRNKKAEVITATIIEIPDVLNTPKNITPDPAAKNISTQPVPAEIIDLATPTITPLIKTDQEQETVIKAIINDLVTALELIKLAPVPDNTTQEEEKPELSISISTTSLTSAEKSDDEELSPNPGSPLSSNAMSQQDLTRSITGTTDTGSELESNFSPRSRLSNASTSLNGNDTYVQPAMELKSVEQIQQEIKQAGNLPTQAEETQPSNDTTFRLNHKAKFFAEPVQFSVEYLLTYMPKKCEFYAVEKEFIDQVLKLEQELALGGLTATDGSPVYFATYIVGGSLTDRVLKQFEANLRAIPNPPAALIDYLNRDMFKRELIVDDHDILTLLALGNISQIATTMGLSQLIRKESVNQEIEGYAPQIEFLSFIDKKADGSSVKIDFVHKDVINIAQEASERDSGLFLDRDGNLIDISGYGLRDLVLSQVRLTIMPTEEYFIEPLKLMHTIHTSTKRHLAIYESEKIKECLWITNQIQASFLNSALRKLFFPGRMVRNYRLLHEFKLFQFLFGPHMSGAMLADNQWIQMHLENSEQQQYPSLLHLHAIFIVSFVMQNILIQSNSIYYNTSTVNIEFQNPNIINACYVNINWLPIFRDVFSACKPEGLVAILEIYINSWKLHKKDLIAHRLQPVQAPPAYHNDHPPQQQIRMTSPQGHTNPPANLHRSQTAPLIFNQRQSNQPPAYQNNGQYCKTKGYRQ